jgi:hypothetical protein
MPPLGYRHFDQVLDAARRKSIELDALQAYWLVSLLLSSDGQTGSNSQLTLTGLSTFPELQRWKRALAIMRSLTTRSPDCGTEARLPAAISKGHAVRLLMHACQEIGVAGVVADGVEEWVHADECHVEAVAVERVLERVEGMVEFVDA